jgi:UPF0176 protein
MTKFEICAFYRFAPLPRFAELRAPLVAAGRRHRALGSFLLASEGLNGTLCAPKGEIAALMNTIRSITGISDIQEHFTAAPAPPFKKLKVRLKKKIVTIGDRTVDPVTHVGTYVDPEDWNRLIASDDVILIDTRNDYEVSLGTFKGAIDPQTESFSEFPEFVKRKLAANKQARIALFCTGGIRCEKATSYLVKEGFENVFHLKGGILGYLSRIPHEQSLWEGSCFVFDERGALDQSLAPVSPSSPALRQCSSSSREAAAVPFRFAGPRVLPADNPPANDWPDRSSV